jgi:hypothetical protein
MPLTARLQNAIAHDAERPVGVFNIHRPATGRFFDSPSLLVGKRAATAVQHKRFAFFRPRSKLDALLRLEQLDADSIAWERRRGEADSHRAYSAVRRALALEDRSTREAKCI